MDNRFSNAPPAKGYKYVRVTNFAEFDEMGRLSKLCCKLCGTVIAQRTAKVINRRLQDDGRLVEQVETTLVRNQHYAELDIALEGNWNCSTSICRRCSTGQLKPEILKELARAELIDQRTPEPIMENLLQRKAISFQRKDLNKLVRLG